MGGKSRKTGASSYRLIARLKANRERRGIFPSRTKARWDKECEEVLAKMGGKIIEGIKEDCEEWNRKLAELNAKGRK